MWMFANDHHLHEALSVIRNLAILNSKLKYYIIVLILIILKNKSLILWMLVRKQVDLSQQFFSLEISTIEFC